MSSDEDYTTVRETNPLNLVAITTVEPRAIRQSCFHFLDLGHCDFGLVPFDCRSYGN